jgi:hypothetical protein
VLHFRAVLAFAQQIQRQSAAWAKAFAWLGAGGGGADGEFSVCRFDDVDGDG